MVSLRSFTGIKGTEWEKLGILIEKFVTRYKIQGTRYKEGPKIKRQEAREEEKEQNQTDRFLAGETCRRKLK